MEQLDQFYFERWSQKPDWTEIGPTKKLRLLNLIYHINKYIPNKSQINLIDYGCGSGWLFYYLKNIGINNLYAYDVTPSSLEIVGEKFPFLKGIWSSHKPFPSNIPKMMFDCCTSIEVIEHIIYEEKTNYLIEINQLLKVGGYLYITTPNRLYYDKAISDKDKQPIEDWLTPTELNMLLEKTGFQVISKGSIYFRPYFSLIHKFLLSKPARYFAKIMHIESFINHFMNKKMLGLSMYFFAKKVKQIDL